MLSVAALAAAVWGLWTYAAPEEHLAKPVAVATPAPHLTPDQKRIVQKLQSIGALRTNLHDHEAYVDPSVWAQMDIDVKQKLAWVLGAAVVEQGGDCWVTILDKKSGKELGRYADNSGLSVE